MKTRMTGCGWNKRNFTDIVSGLNQEVLEEDKQGGTGAGGVAQTGVRKGDLGVKLTISSDLKTGIIVSDLCFFNTHFPLEMVSKSNFFFLTFVWSDAAFHLWQF